MADRMHEGLADGVDKTAARVVANAKGSLGHYQEDWARLKDRTIQRKLRKNKAATIRAKKKDTYRATGTSADAPLVDDGLLRGSITKQTDRRKLESEVGSPLEYAAVHEFGSEDDTIPERPYLRPALKEEVEMHLLQDLKDGIHRRVSRG